MRTAKSSGHLLRCAARVSGTSYVLTPGVYGDPGFASAANTPGARSGHAMLVDSSGRLMMSGGHTQGNVDRVMNDFWRFAPDSGLWTW